MKTFTMVHWFFGYAVAICCVANITIVIVVIVDVDIVVIIITNGMLCCILK